MGIKLFLAPGGWLPTLLSWVSKTGWSASLQPRNENVMGIVWFMAPRLSLSPDCVCSVGVTLALAIGAALIWVRP
jgi:hypothetical protein